MPIDVHCDCGNVYSVGPELSGKKLRCKTCQVVLKVPLVPITGADQDTGPPSTEYEVIKDDPTAISCPTCGAAGKRGDAVCLACGAELGDASPGLVEKVPKPVLILLVLAVVGGVFGTVGYKIYKSSKLSGLIAEGRDKLDKGDLKGARAKFEQAYREFEKDERSVDGLIQVGLAPQAPDWKLVKTHAPTLLAKLPRGPQKAQILIALARAQYETKDFQGAVKSANDAKANDDKIEGVDEIVGLAGAGENLTLDPEVVDPLKRAYEAGSRDPRVPLTLAKIFEKDNKIKEARLWADKATVNAGKDATIWLECARLREKDGDRKSAIGALEKAADADEANVAARVQLAQALLEENAIERALKNAKVAKEKGPSDPAASRVLGEALLESGKYEEACAELANAEKLAAEDAMAVFLHGKALVRSAGATRAAKDAKKETLSAEEQRTLDKQIQDGVDRLDRALKKLEKAPLWLEAGRIVLLDGKSERALLFLEKALAAERGVEKPDKKAQVDVRWLLAAACGRVDGGHQKFGKRIEETLDDAIKIDPNRKEPYLELGHHRIADPDPNYRTGLEAYETGLKVFPDDPDLLYRAGYAGVKAKGREQFAKAEKYLKHLQEVAPKYEAPTGLQTPAALLDAAIYGAATSPD